MKVYFIGAHSTGKTTLARYVAKEYKLPFLNEVARTILAERELNLNSLRTDPELANDYQSDVFYSQFKEEEKFKEFVSDRSFDNLAYAAQHTTKLLSSLIKDPILLKYIEDLKSKENFIFFVRPSRATLHNDGVREALTWDGIVAIDAMIKLLAEMFELEYFQINTDSMQERVNLINSVLRRFSKGN